MNALTLQATFCGLLHGLGKLAFRADKTAADLLAALPDTPEWAAVRGGAAAGSDAARCAAFARSLSVTADTPAAEPASSRYRPLRSIFSHLNGEHPGYSVPAARPDGALHDPVQDAPDIPAAVYRELYQELTGQLTGLQFSPAQANALLGLLESQCSALPASTARDEDRDISLYDQLKLKNEKVDSNLSNVNNRLTFKIAVSLIADLMKKCDMPYAMSVFLPECGIS